MLFLLCKGWVSVSSWKWERGLQIRVGTAGEELVLLKYLLYQLPKCSSPPCSGMLGLAL